MPADALALALLAAVVHAAWNLVLSGARDPEGVAPVAMGIGCLLLVPFGVAAWDIDAAVWPYVAGSVAFEIAYLALLARAYGRAELGFVYPVARGSAPVLVLVVGVVALGARPSALEAVAVLVVVAGIVLVRGVALERGRGDLALALAVGAAIAGYTLLDDRGIEHAAPLAYLTLVLVPTGVALVAAERLRGRDVRAAVGPRAALVGVGMVAGYGLALAALDRAAAAPVAAVRETSIVLAVGAVAVTGRERVTPARAAGAVLVAAGVAALALA